MKLLHCRLFGRVLTVAVVLYLLTVSSLAQSLDNVSFNGRVTDANNAPVSGANVTVTSNEKGLIRTAQTDEEGIYRLIELPPGKYVLSVEAKGFGKQTTAELTTIAAQNIRQDFTLSVSEVSVETTVQADGDNTPVVDTTRTIVGGTVTQREVEELPNVGRNALDLVFTLGGVTEEPLSTRDLSSDRGQRGVTAPGNTPEEAGTFALAGGAAYSNNITIDGLDNNDDRSAGFRFQPSLDSISEVQVITNQFSSEYGRASGGRVNILTRGGSNNFRGRAYMYFRDDNLNANTWNNNRRGIARPSFTNYNPGFTFGGPLIKNKLFFFTSYEYDNIQEDTLIDVFVPVDRVARLNLPAPTDLSRTFFAGPSGQTVPVAPYITTAETPARRHIFTARGDWNINDKQNATFSYQFGRSNDLRQFSGTNRLADALIGRVRNSDAVNATHNFVISPKVINQIRFQYSRLRPNSTPSAGADAPVILVNGFTPPGESATGTQIYGASTSGSSDRKEDRWQIQETINYLAGTHNLKFGADYQRVNSQFIDRFDATGTYTFSSFADLVRIDSTTSVPNIRFAQNFSEGSTVKNNYLGIFVNDDWRARQNLTVSFGVRYERESVIADNNNVGPRFSVAWNPFPKEQKTVLRFGAGIFYNRVLLRTIDDFTSTAQTLRFNSTSINNEDVRRFLVTQFPNNLTLDTRIPVGSGVTRSVRELSVAASEFRSIESGIKIPESYQFNFGFERQLLKGLAFETNLTWNKTVHLWREYNPNAPVLPSGLNDLSRDGQISFTDYLLTNPLAGVCYYLGSNADTNGISNTLPSGSNCPSGLTRYVNLNTTNNGDNNGNCRITNGYANTPICRAFEAIDRLRPLATQGFFDQQERVASIGNSLYRGINFELRNRYRKFGGSGFGGSLRAAYTLSSLKDDGLVNTSEATIPGDFRREWSRSLLDRRHRLAISGTFDTPKYLGGIRLSPIFRFGSSAPFNILIGGNDRNLDDISNDRPNYVGNTSDIIWRRFSSGYPADLARNFSLATIGSAGSLPRNAGRGPRLYVFDMNFTREFKLNEKIKLRPSVEVGNLPNMTVFSFGSNFIDFANLNVADLQAAPTATQIQTQRNARDNFLVPTRTVRPRQVRFGLRLDF